MLITAAYIRQMYDTRRVNHLIDDGREEGPDEAILTTIIAAADSLVKDALTRQYTVAEIEASPTLKRLCSVIALYMLENRRGDVTPAIEKAYRESLEMLQSFIAGDMKLKDVSELMPRITQINASDLYEESGLFDGYPEVEE